MKWGPRFNRYSGHNAPALDYSRNTRPLQHYSSHSARQSQRRRQGGRDSVRGLQQVAGFPRQGRKGRIEGTRELVFPGLPYIVVYRIQDQNLEIVRIYHGAQDWP
jgi:plasmid stabilization system protein ParE